MSFVDDLITSIFSLDEIPQPKPTRKRRNAITQHTTTTPTFTQTIDFSDIDSYYDSKPTMNIKKSQVPTLCNPPIKKSEPQPQPKSEPQSEPQPEPQSEPQPEPQSEPQPEPQSEPQSEPQPEPQSEPQPQPESEHTSQPEKNYEPVKSDTKSIHNESESAESESAESESAESDSDSNSESDSDSNSESESKNESVKSESESSASDAVEATVEIEPELEHKVTVLPVFGSKTTIAESLDHQVEQFNKYKLKPSELIKKDIIILHNSLNSLTSTLEYVLNKLSNSKEEWNERLVVLAGSEIKESLKKTLIGLGDTKFESVFLKSSFGPIKKELQIPREYDSSCLCIIDYELVDENVYDFIKERPYRTQFVIICNRLPKTSIVDFIGYYNNPIIISSVSNKTNHREFYKKYVQKLTNIDDCSLDTYIRELDNNDYRYLVVYNNKFYVN
jgi:hypothetical protein